MFERVKAARERLRGYANVTPVMTSRILNELMGMEVFLKCENFQRVGAFKFRGAFNTISQLTDQQRDRGIITYSILQLRIVSLVTGPVGQEIIVPLSLQSYSIRSTLDILISVSSRLYS